MYGYLDCTSWTNPTKTLVNRVGRKLIENDVEAYLIKKCKEDAWLCEKFTSPQRRSVPDRMITTNKGLNFPYGFIFFIELKAPNKTATEAQLLDHTERREKGNLVMVCDCYEQIDEAFRIVGDILATVNEVKLPYWLIL